MGKEQKKLQKKKERERAVRKKILLKREAAHVMAKRIEAQDRLERAVNKQERKQQPIRNISPELKKTLEMVEQMKKDPDVDSSTDRVRGETTAMTWDSFVSDKSDENNS